MSHPPAETAMTRLMILFAALALSACATLNEDVVRLQAEARIQTEKTEQARLNTLAALAGGEKAGDGARVAGIINQLVFGAAIIRLFKLFRQNIYLVLRPMKHEKMERNL
jgi:hypothetical protein